MACTAPSLDAGFLGGLLRFIDCEAQTIGASGYQAFAAPGSTFSLILAGLLTLFVALFGYRMMLGHVPSVSTGVLAFVKIGIVLVLTTSWPAYRVLVHDVVLKGPADLSASIGGASSLPGTTGGMVARLEAADRALVTLSVLGAGQPSIAVPPKERGMYPPFAGFEAFALGGARMLYLIGIIGAFAAVRLVAGLLLALAPFFFAFLLFDATRGLFEGWLRVLVGAALGALGVSIVLGIELALLEPWLTGLLATRAANIAVPNAPVELLVVTIVFCIVLAVMLWAIARLAMGFRLPAIGEWAATWATPRSEIVARERSTNELAKTTSAESYSRAAAIADAVAASQRRETNSNAPAQGFAGARVPVQAAGRDLPTAIITPLGQSFRRRTISRVSASAGRRDRRT